MAEFTDVMEQAKRMCKAHIPCSRCALYRVRAGGGCAFDYLLSVSFDEVERKIRAWAEKHPDGDKPERLANARPVRRGVWQEGEFPHIYKCSACGRYTDWISHGKLPPPPFCCWCGAKMKK